MQLYEGDCPPNPSGWKGSGYRHIPVLCHAVTLGAGGVGTLCGEQREREPDS